MSRKVFNMQGGRHSAAALSAFLSVAFDGDVAAGLNVEPTGTTGLKVLVKPGAGQIKTGQNFSRLIQIDADEEVTIAAASPSNERHDLVVAYIDSKVTPTTAVIDNTNGVLKLASVAGTPSAMPTDPTTATIQSKIGAGNPYIILARVTVPQMASSLTKSNITDLRSRVLIGNSSQIGNGIIESRNINAGSIAEFLPNMIQSQAEGLKIVTGWGQFRGSGGNSATVEVQFPHEFKNEVVMAMVSYNGFRTGTKAEKLSDFTNKIGAGVVAEFLVRDKKSGVILLSTSGLFGGAWHGVSWIVIGH